MTAGFAGDSAPTEGAVGGDGIELTSTSTGAIIRDCEIFAGDGGNSTDGSSNGGRGGHGIFVNGASNAQIQNLLVRRTGRGGSDSGSGIGGAGGDGVNITSASADIEVTDCIFRNTGLTISGGAAGMAVNDSVPLADPAKSIILRNIGYEISNTATRYNIGAVGSEQGVSLTYPPTATAVNVNANVYIP